MSDRFARFKTDPRFRRPKKQANKVEIDARFRGVIDSKPIKQASRVDKYGRKLAATHEKDQLRKFYSLQDEEDDVEEKKIDYARGEGLIESSSSSSSDEEEDGGDVVIGGTVMKPIHLLNEEEDEEGPEIDLDEAQFAELDAEAEKNVAADAAATGEVVKPTKRIAAVNLDWDHVKASHLFRIFSSALVPLNANATPSSLNSGRLLNVCIYPSEFGKIKMAEEDKAGPPPELFKPTAGNKKPKTQHEEEEVTKVAKSHDDGEEYDQNALRRYQLERLRYYYAIATFTDVAAASHVYTELEGTELERSANLFDLSYVPDSMTFEDPTRDEAKEETLSASYQPLNFTTDALRHSNVKLTWDEDDPERTRVTRRALSKKEIEEMDFQALIASSSSSSDDDAAVPTSKKSKKTASKEEAQRIRALLLSGNDENLPEGWGGQSLEKQGDNGAMEITFTPGLSGALGTGAKPKEEETTLEKYQRKEREKKKAKKAKRKEKLASATAGLSGEEDVTRKTTKSRKLDGDAFFGNSSEDEESDAEENAQIRQKGSKPATDAELSLLMEDDEGLLPSGRKHFDMNNIIRAEKRSEKGHKGRGSKRKKREGEQEEDEFEMDVQDSRFRAVLDDHRFAIDPANPHFKKTKNMKRLLHAKAGGGDEDRHKKRRRR